MIKYFLKTLEMINKIMDVPKLNKQCEKCQFTDTCEIQDSNLCGYDEIQGDK